MTELANIIEAVIFAATDPVDLRQLIHVTGKTKSEVATALAELAEFLEHTGLRLSSHNDTYRLLTSPVAAAALATYHDQSIKPDLSRPALETLAIIAYSGPATRQQIEIIRGVGSDQMIKNLIQRGLVEESGRSNEAGRPSLYRVTHLFLQTVGITNIGELPPLPEAIAAQ